MNSYQNKLLDSAYQKLANNKDSAVILLDVNGNILTWNDGAKKIKGYTSQEIIGQHISIFYMPLDREAGLPQKLINQAKTEGKATFVGKRVKKDGSTFWGSILITAIYDDEKNLIGFTNLSKILDDQPDGDKFPQFAV